MAQQSDSDSGCAGCIALVIGIALVVCAVVSVAAIVDPFAWLPSLKAIFASDCQGDCDLSKRFPGFWWHVAVNFGYAMLALALAIWLWSTTIEFRAARTARFGSDAEVERYLQARARLAVAAAALAALGLVPVVTALA